MKENKRIKAKMEKECGADSLGEKAVEVANGHRVPPVHICHSKHLFHLTS